MFWRYGPTVRLYTDTHVLYGPKHPYFSSLQSLTCGPHMLASPSTSSHLPPSTSCINAVPMKGLLHACVGQLLLDARALARRWRLACPPRSAARRPRRAGARASLPPGAGVPSRAGMKTTTETLLLPTPDTLAFHHRPRAGHEFLAVAARKMGASRKAVG